MPRRWLLLLLAVALWLLLVGHGWEGRALAFESRLSGGATQSLYLRLAMPTSSTSANQHSATVTIMAVAQ